MPSTELLKGTLKTVVLKLLSVHGKMYGYEITQLVKELTKDKLILTEGALYPALHALEAEGAVITETVFVGKRIRKYYSLTKTGKGLMKEKVNEFSDFVSTMRLLLNFKPSV